MFVNYLMNLELFKVFLSFLQVVFIVLCFHNYILICVKTPFQEKSVCLSDQDKVEESLLNLVRIVKICIFE